MVPGVATLDRSPDQSPGVRPISPSTGTKGNQEGWPSWVEYRSGGTGGPHPGVDIFPDLSPRAKPYCGVKCSQGLHFPATDCGAWGDRGHNPPTVEGEGQAPVNGGGRTFCSYETSQVIQRTLKMTLVVWKLVMD